MTGKIKTLNTVSASGLIDAENGLRLHFDSCAVLAYDATNLAVGQLVTFDLEHGTNSRAVNICVQKSRKPSSAEGKRETQSLRYIGFEPVARIRTFPIQPTPTAHNTSPSV